MNRNLLKFIASVPLGVVLSILLAVGLAFFVAIMSFCDYWRGLYKDIMNPQTPKNEGVWEKHIRKLDSQRQNTFQHDQTNQ